MEKYFLNNAKYKMSIMIVTLLIAIIQYNLLIINGYSNADGIGEGLYYYTNEAWALTGCGRWLLHYIELLQGNVVIPLIKVLIYAVAISLVSMMIADLWKLKLKATIIICAILMTSPVMVWQMSYYHVAESFAISCLLSCFFVYSLYSIKGLKRDILAILAITCSLGLYQSYIGMSAFLILLTITINLLFDRTSIKVEVRNLLHCVIDATIGAAFYLVIYRIELMRRGLHSSSRAAQFSLQETVNALPTSIVESYKHFWGYFFTENVMGVQRKLNTLLLLCFCILLGYCIYQVIKEKKYSNLFVILLALFLCPIAAELSYIIFPQNGISYQMQYQLILVYTFLIALCEMIVTSYGKSFLVGLKRITLLLICLVIWISIIRGNATFRCYELSYRHINFEMSMILDDIYHLDGYVKDETPIIFGGFVNDDVLRKNNQVYRYAIALPYNVAFWEDTNGATFVRRNYLIDYFGVDGGEIDAETYNRITNSQEYNDMNVWPANDSIRLVDGYAIAKLQ